ncbi:hypothetical protein JJJ17_07700 [Paracoccus caeni]|uniref:Uncharacterized protein n=1 Tax=Paracoccus caeni TaxID=657651 RepID=A0A934W0H6_9RHOB|nr:hypothetical protein [Paracoccus caeni]MBK4215804.1 hypothetical protein [Paracoccus caeni]
MADLHFTICDLRQRISALPQVEYMRGDFLEQHKAHREAARALGQYLTETYGAKVSERHDANRITMHRITSTSTSGLIGAFQNWIAAAEKRHAITIGDQS